MTDQLDFAYGGFDTGESDVNAISPIADSERAIAVTFNRPHTATHNRTEILRIEANRARWVRDADRALLVYLTGGALSWDAGTGEVTLAASAYINVVPMVSPGASRGEAWIDSGSTFVTRFAHGTLDTPAPGNQIQVISQRRAHEGGNEITITIDDSPGLAGIDVNVYGDGSVTDPGSQPSKDDIQVRLDVTAGHTIADVITAVNSDPVAGALVQLTYVGSGADTDPAYATLSAVQLEGGFDGVWHQISDTALANFFAASSDNALDPGDTLAIWYDSTKNRRQSFEAGGAHVISSVQLVNLSREPEKAQNAIPVCKRVSNELLFPNGTLVASGGSTTIIGPDALRSDINKGISSPPSPGGNTYGAEIVGVDTSGYTEISPATNSAQDVFDALEADAADTETRLSAAETDITQGGVGVQYLGDVYPGAPAGVAQGYGFRLTASRAGFIRGPWDVLTAAGATNGIKQCTNGRAWFVFDGADIYALDTKELLVTGAALPDPAATGQDLWSISAAPTPIDMDCNGNVLAVLTATTLHLYNAETGAVLGTPWGVDNGTANPVSPARVLVRGDRVWVIWKQQDAGAQYVWYLQARNGADPSGAMSGLLTLASDASVGTHALVAADADYKSGDSSSASTNDVYAIINNTSTNTNFLVPVSDEVVSSPVVLSTTSGEGAADLVVTDRYIYVGGIAMETPVDYLGVTGTGRPLLCLTRQNPQVDVRGAVLKSMDYTASPSLSTDRDVAKLAADGQYLYAVLNNQDTGGANELQIFDARLNLIDQVTLTATSDFTIQSVVCDGRFVHLVVYDNDGGVSPETKLHTYVVNPTGGAFGFDAQGRAPMWTNHYLLDTEM